MAQKVARRLSKCGVTLKLCNTSRDLGIDAAAGQRRVTKVQQSRARKAVARNSRIKKLARANPEAVKLHRTGAAPQWKWGHTAFGSSPAKALELRRLIDSWLMR